MINGINTIPHTLIKNLQSMKEQLSYRLLLPFVVLQQVVILHRFANTRLRKSLLNLNLCAVH